MSGGDRSRTMEVQEVPLGSTGTILRRTLKDDGVAIDLSAATGSVTYDARTPGGTAIVTDGGASFTTDGSDGKVQLTLTTALVGTIADRIITFSVAGYNSGVLVSWPFILRPIRTGVGT